MRTFHSTELLASPPKAVNYVVDRFIPSGGICDIAGPPGEGKSTIALSLVAAVSTGKSWFGMKVAQMPVAWISGEASDQDAIARDLHRLKVDSESDITFILPDVELFRFVDDLWITTNEGRAAIDSVREKRIGLVVIDTVGSVVAGSKEIDNCQQRQLARHIRAETRGLTVITISHTNQASATTDLDWRLHYLSRAGGNGYPGAIRWAAGVSELRSEKDAQAVGLEDYDVAGRRLVAFGASKHNEMPTPCWTNRTPAIFELKKDGSLMLFKDGRELKPISEQVAEYSRKRKEETRNGERPAVCTI